MVSLRRGHVVVPVFGLALLCLAILASAAYADSFFSDWKYFHNAKYYKNREAMTLFDDGSGVTSRVYLTYLSGSGLASCYVQTYLFDGSDNLRELGSADLILAAGEGTSVRTDGKATAHGQYYAYGITWVPATGGGYAEIVTYGVPKHTYDP